MGSVLSARRSDWCGLGVDCDLSRCIELRGSSSDGVAGAAGERIDGTIGADGDVCGCTMGVRLTIVRHVAAQRACAQRDNQPQHAQRGWH